MKQTIPREKQLSITIWVHNQLTTERVRNATEFQNLHWEELATAIQEEFELPHPPGYAFVTAVEKAVGHKFGRKHTGDASDPDLRRRIRQLEESVTDLLERVLILEHKPRAPRKKKAVA